jgi:hypothetical protein
MDIEVKMKVPAPPAPFVPVPYPNASTVSLVDSQIGGNFTVDSFFDIVYQIDGQSTFSNVGGSSMDVSARGSSIGGDFAVDSFFDITYQLSPGPAGEPVAVASPEVDVRCSELKIGGDFVVDSFFDIEYRIEFQGKPGSSSLEADGSAANVSVRESDIAGDVLLDTSLQVLSNNPLHAESSVGGSSALFQGTNVGGDFNVDSFFDITVTDVDPRPGQRGQRPARKSRPEGRSARASSEPRSNHRFATGRIANSQSRSHA